MSQSLANGRYELRAVLGEGGMGRVWSAWDTMLQVERAVKLLNPGLRQSRTIRERFLTEARTMARLSHPNIVQVVDVGIDGDQAYMVMELLGGGSLQDRIDTRGALPASSAARVMLSVLSALGAAHKAGVIHRDIKPQNILLTPEGLPKLADFGIARIEQKAKQLTKTGSVMGTVGFMAPEQRISARRVDGRADLYAVGTTLFASVTAQMPIELYASELDDELLAGVPEALRPVISQATRYKPEDRYETAAAMAKALSAAMQGLPESKSIPMPLPDPGATIAPSAGTRVPEGTQFAGQEHQEVRPLPTPVTGTPSPPTFASEDGAPLLVSLAPGTPPPVTDAPVPVDSLPGPARKTGWALWVFVLGGLGLAGLGVAAVIGVIGVIAATQHGDSVPSLADSALGPDLVLEDLPPGEPTERPPEAAPVPTGKAPEPTREPTPPPKIQDDPWEPAEPIEADPPSLADSAPPSISDSTPSEKAVADAPPDGPSPLADLNGTWAGNFNGRPLALRLTFKADGTVTGNGNLSVAGPDVQVKFTGTHRVDSAGKRRVTLTGKLDQVLLTGAIEGNTMSGRALVRGEDKGAWSADHQ